MPKPVPHHVNQMNDGGAAHAGAQPVILDTLRATFV
jgi:hypothetical protein